MVEEASETREILEEKLGKYGQLAAAAALAGTIGHGIGRGEAEAPLPQIIYTTADDPTPLSDKKADMSEATKLLALTIWGEARSDGPEAMRAVGHVVINRIRSPRAFGKNIKEVVWKRKAFSCWNAGDPNRESMKKIASLPETHPSKVRWNQAVKIAQDITSGRSKDPTNGALFYHTKAMGLPYWVSKDMKPIATIASHLFYKTDAKAKSDA